MTRAVAAIDSVLIFLFQEGGSCSHINVRPGQWLVQWAFPLGIEARFESSFIEGAKPIFIIKTFIPGIKG